MQRRSICKRQTSRRSESGLSKYRPMLWTRRRPRRRVDVPQRANENNNNRNNGNDRNNNNG